jgi:hypothetical protein
MLFEQVRLQIHATSLNSAFLLGVESPIAAVCMYAAITQAPLEHGTVRQSMSIRSLHGGPRVDMVCSLLENCEPHFTEWMINTPV